MDEKRLYEVCFSLAEDLMWEKTTSPLEKLPEQMNELSVMTENFVNLSKSNFYQVENLPDGQEILIGAIRYLNAIAIPPLRGNYEWFDYSLTILLELAYPSGGPDQSGLPFLLRARNGIEQLIDWANQPEDE
ncbi:hypothetical protein JHJ32_08240 [Parapedobacter sp. ISTM3]|uniref:hypothetical protein n=1 Tax=Parapedobacter sp. ISTM3 TaxID=2800130 RepID=UPI001903FD8B|nr:hypothetical protein [Parapedobacter sp. ISTM3]MBK1439970.1 hypothetical protein [Parapedobacter sp. ISTM3]